MQQGAQPGSTVHSTAGSVSRAVLLGGQDFVCWSTPLVSSDLNQISMLERASSAAVEEIGLAECSGDVTSEGGI